MLLTWDWQLVFVLVIVAVAAGWMIIEAKHWILGDSAPRSCGGGCNNCADSQSKTPPLVTLEIPENLQRHSS